MLNKLASLIIFVGAFLAAIIAFKEPHNLVFSFLSENHLTVGARVGLAATAVAVSLKPNLLAGYWRRFGIGIIGIALLTIGLTLFSTTHLQGAVYAYIRSLDMLILAETGVIFTGASLNAEVVPRQRPVKQLQLSPNRFLAPSLSLRRLLFWQA